MTVRAWFTISALVLAGLAGAFAYRLFAPVSPPQIVVRTDGVRLPGVLARACWPQRAGHLRCTQSDEPPTEAPIVAGSGVFRIVVTFPAQPTQGAILIERVGGDAVLRRAWDDTVSYRLSPGTYRLRVQAGSSAGAFVRYVFGFKVTRTGS